MRQKIFTEEEIRQHKIEYMKNTKWFCDICNKNLNITSKTNHLKTKMHNRKNQSIENDLSDLRKMKNQLNEKNLLIAHLRNQLSQKQ